MPGERITFERLDAAPVRRTIDRLARRVEARFPGRNINRIAAELDALARDVETGARAGVARVRVARRISRVLIAVVLLAATAAIAFALVDAFESGPEHSFEWLPLIESAINDAVFAAIAIFFLHAVPSRMERGHLLTLLHRLRSLAHIIDMHQLAKDPERLRADFQPTDESLEPGLDRNQMENYLDYCSELLSLVGKVAALCAEETTDPVVLDTVSTIETLTNGISRKIWQKIALLAG